MIDGVSFMWCRNCNIETNEIVCPICNSKTIEDLPVEIYFYNNCKIPIVKSINEPDKSICPICKSETKYLTTDIRPVFPEERILLAILLDKEPSKYMYSSVWASISNYFVDGKSIKWS